ncbi:glycerol transporter, partial [Coemansia sp. RSA 2706]
MPDGSLEHAIAVDTSSAEPMPNVPPREHPARPSTAAGAQPLPGTSAQSQRKHREPAASRFGTGEFKVYYLVYLTMVPYMAYTMWQASSPERAAYAEYSHELSPGWLLGRKIDLSDGQWSTFREHLPAFALAMFAFVALNRVAQACLRPGLAGQRGALRQLWFTGAYALAFVVVLSGASVVFVAGFAWGNYALARACAGRRWAPAAFWAYGLAMLFANEHYHGYRFGDMSASLEWLDAWRGLLPRWDVTFNLTMLRMLSFSMDLHWRRQQERAAGADRVDALAAGGADPERQRVERAAFAGNYCFGNYWAYVAYPPLYLTGPVITFNDFVAQKRQPARVGGRAVAAYGARLAAAMLLMELVLHSVYSVAICKWAQWDAFSVFEISLLGYMRLTFIWLKLLIIWRFARFWALADGLATTENMRRCMSNNYSLQQFWRDWHCSFNRWLVRYVYVPLGGRRTSTWNTFVIFTFVALWHDLTLRLLQWA